MTRHRPWTPTAQSLAIIAGCLKKRQRDHRTKAIVLALLGVVFCAGAVVVLGSIFWGLQGAHRRPRLYTYHPWKEMIAFTGIVVLPLLFLMEWATRGMYFDNAMDSISDANFFAGRRAAGAAFIEICLWGPRMIMSAFRRGRARRSYAGHDVKLGATMLAKLLRDENGLPTSQILGDASDTAVSTMTYLTFYDWIDISKAGDRVWLLTNSRELLRSAVRQKK